MAKIALSDFTFNLSCEIRFEHYVIPGPLAVHVVSTDTPIC